MLCIMGYGYTVLLLGLYSNSVEMQDDSTLDGKQNRASEIVSGSEALKVKEQFGNVIDSIYA